MTSPLDFSSLYTSTAQSGQSSANAAFHPTLVFKPLIPLLPILYHLPLLPHHRLLLLAVSLHLLLPRNAGGLQARSTEFLHFRLSHPVDLICIQESNHNSFSSHRIPGFSTLRSDSTHSRSSRFSLLMPCTLAVASSFSSGRAYPSLNFLPLFFLRLTPALIM